MNKLLRTAALSAATLCFFSFHAGGKETGAQNLTWVLPAVTKEVLRFQKTLQKEPPIKLGTPDPYRPE